MSYCGPILVHSVMRQTFAGKMYTTFYNIWDPVILSFTWVLRQTIITEIQILIIQRSSSGQRASNFYPIWRWSMGSLRWRPKSPGGRQRSACCDWNKLIQKRKTFGSVLNFSFWDSCGTDQIRWSWHPEDPREQKSTKEKTTFAALNRYCWASPYCNIA